MSPSALAYLAGMAALFVGSACCPASTARSGSSPLPASSSSCSPRCCAFAAAGATDEGQRFGHRVALTCLLIGIAALVMYVATTESVVRSLTLDAERRGSLARCVALAVAGRVAARHHPMLVVDWAIVSSPVMMPCDASAICRGTASSPRSASRWCVPINFIAGQAPGSVGSGVLQTAQPGTATLAIVESLELPVHVRIFMPPSSDVAQELQAYFAQLEGRWSASS